MKYANVTDTNGNHLGRLEVVVEFAAGRPSVVRHAGSAYRATGKVGRNLKTGEASWELSTRDETAGEDRRIWANAAGCTIWED